MSLVQLVFEAVGAPATADAVKLVTAALDATVAAATRATTATTAAVPAADALTAAAKKEAEALATTRDVATSLNLGLVDMAAIIAAKLTPSLAPATAAVQGLGNASAAASQQVATSAAQLASQANASRTSALASDYFAARQSAATPAVTAAVVAHRSLREQLSDMSAVLTDKLTPSLDPAMKGMLALGATALTVRAAWGLFTGVLADGAHFTALQARTGESIRNLVVIENAFKNAGVAGEGLTRSVSMIDSVLDGLDARGKKSDITLARLGTTVAEMKVMGLAEQLATLRAGFAGIETQSERAAIVMQLFGREGGQLLQVLGNPAAWSAAEANASGYAAQIERNAERFRTMEKNIDGVRLQLRTMAAAALEQVVPALSSVASLIGSMGGAAGLGTVLGAAGPSAVGGLAALWGVDRLDQALLNTADRFEGRMTGALSGAAANVTGALAKFLPVGLAAAVAGAIIFGVVQAYQDSQIQAIRDRESGAQGVVAPLDKNFRTAGSQGDVQANLLAAQMEYAKLNLEQQALQAKAAADRDALRTAGPFAAEGGGAMPPLRFTDADQARLNVLNDALPKLAARIQNQYGNATTATAQVDANRTAAELAAAKALVAPLVTAAEEITKKFESNRLAAMSPADRVVALQGQRAGVEQQLAGINPGLDSNEKDILAKKLKNEIFEITEKQKAAEKEIAAEVTRSENLEAKRAIYTLETQMLAAKASGNELLAQQLKEQIEGKRVETELQGKDLSLAQERAAVNRQIWAAQQAQDAARKTLDADRQATDNQVYQIKLQLAALDADYSRTTTEKWGERKAAIEAEVAALTEAARLDQRRADIAKAAGDYKGAEMFGQSAKQNARGAISAQGDLAQLGPDPQSWSQQWKSVMTEFRSGWEFTAQSVTQSLMDIANNGLTNISNQVAQTAVVTGQWGSLLGNITRQVGVELVSAFIQMGIRWVITKTMMAAADKSIAMANVAALIPIATATSMVWASPATLATIATFGGAAAAAPLEMAGAMMAGQALALGGFERGGWTGGREGMPAGIVHGEEFVFSAPAVRRIGGDRLAALHAGSLTPAAAAPSGSRDGGSGGGRESARNHHWYFDRQAFLDASRDDVESIAAEVFTRMQRS